jgi:hypothetical protein
MSQPETPKPSAAYRIIVAAGLIVAVVSTTGLMLTRFDPGPDVRAQQPPAASDEAPKELKEFAEKYLPSWKGQKPELVILFTGQQHNYEGPCGCTNPQYGGLERRFNFVAQLRAFGLPVVAADLGDIYFPGKFKDQAKLKYVTSMKALDLMQYAAVAVGPEEFRIPLIDALAETVLNNKFSYDVLAANIANKDEFPGQNGPMVKDARVVEVQGSKLKVGIIGTLGQSAVDEVQKLDSNVKFEGNRAAIPRALGVLRAKNPEIRVLLYNGTGDEAKVLAQTIDEFDLILCRSDEAEPRGIENVPAAPGKGKPRARLAFVGHKGKYVGVLGVFRNGENLDLRWELVRLGPEFKTPAEERDNQPVVKVLEEYTKTLKDRDFIAMVPKLMHPTAKELNSPTLKFVGSAACKECHKAEFDVWDESRHAGAYQTLSEHPDAKPPHNRQFDPECVICHTVGFGYESGFGDKTLGFNNADKAKHLWGVGCETCHGPGSLHAAQPKNPVFAAKLSPWRDNKTVHLTDLSIKDKRTTEEQRQVTAEQQIVANQVFKLCFKCHDTDNDHDFQLDKWKKIAHGGGPTVKKKK